MTGIKFSCGDGWLVPDGMGTKIGSRPYTWQRQGQHILTATGDRALDIWSQTAPIPLLYSVRPNSMNQKFDVRSGVIYIGKWRLNGTRGEPAFDEDEDENDDEEEDGDEVGDEEDGDEDGDEEDDEDDDDEEEEDEEEEGDEDDEEEDEDEDGDLLLRVVTYNLGLNIQRNRVKCSDGIITKKCRKRYPSTKGVDDTGMSLCTLNALRMLDVSVVDIVGFQELDNAEAVVKRMPGYSIISNGTCGVMYRKYLDAEFIKIKTKTKKIRSICAAYFPSLELLFLSVWLNHDNGKLQSLESIPLKKSLEGRKVSRIIWTMDSNDYSGNELRNVSLRQNVVPNRTGQRLCDDLKSCCEDSDYTYVGDYIFDTHPELAVSCGMMPQDGLLMSDHRAVQAITTFKKK